MNTQRQTAKSLALVVVIIAGIIVGAQPTPSSAMDTVSSSQPISTAAIQENYGKLPLSFVPNAGQTDEAVHFQVNGLGGTLFFTPQEVVLSLPQTSKNDTSRDFTEHALVAKYDMSSQAERLAQANREQQPPLVGKMQLIGASATPEIIGTNPLPGIVNYFIGNDPRQWHTRIPTYGGIVYRNVYPGIDLQYDGQQGHLKGTYTVAATIDPSVIRWQYAGNTSLSIDAQTGDLMIALSNGNVLREVAPTAWQEKLGSKEAVETHYALENGQVRFALGDYDARLPLVIDPSFVYSTYLGGGNDDSAADIATDGNGNAYIIGTTYSTNFPTLGSIRATNAGNGDVFVTKLNSAGSAILYSTYLGGSGADTGAGIAINVSGNAYLAGSTESANFPVATALQATYGGNGDAFVAKLSITGDTMFFSTYLGGSSLDYANSIAVNNSSNVYITGNTDSTNFPMSNARQGTKSGLTDGFVTAMTNPGTAYLYSTYLGGSGTEDSRGIAVDNSGNVYVTGSTDSTNYPVANAVQATLSGYVNAFVMKLNANGNTLVYSTYLGGSFFEANPNIAVDSGGNAYIVGSTSSMNFPTVSAFQDSLANFPDAFVSKLNATGNGLLFSTYLGGFGSDNGTGIAVDSGNNIFIAGRTTSSDFLTASPYQGLNAGGEDAFVAKIKSSGAAPHPDTIGIFRPSTGNFYLRNSNTTGPADSTLVFGTATDRPVAGDWNGDGIDTAGVYRPSTGQFFLTDSMTNPATVTYTLTLGVPNDQPIVGDWDGDGKDSVGVFRPSNGLLYLRNALTTGFADFAMVLGSPGDVGVAGDWDGDGIDSPGVYRPSNQVFYLTNRVCNNCTVFADAQLTFGIAGDTPFVGDWDGDGKTGIGVYRQTNGLTYIKNTLTTGFANANFVFGTTNDFPLAGYWVRVTSGPASQVAPPFQP